MKLLFLCAATAFAVAPPRIELNLASTQSYGVATINRLANSEVERALVQTALIRPDTAQITPARKRLCGQHDVEPGCVCALVSRAETSQIDTFANSSVAASSDCHMVGCLFLH